MEPNSFFEPSDCFETDCYSILDYPLITQTRKPGPKAAVETPGDTVSNKTWRHSQKQTLNRPGGLAAHYELDTTFTRNWR